MITFQSLENIEFEVLVKALHISFADYFVPMTAPASFWEKYWKINRVRYDLSFGIFDNDVLVAFMVNGIDYRNGKLVAFNVGTGVLPSHRGQRFVQQLYDFAFPILKNNGVENFGLEVVTKNIQAIKAYQRVGFKIDKLYQCFSKSDLVVRLYVEYSAKEVNEPNWEIYEPFTKEDYSWGVAKQGIALDAKSFSYFELFHDNELIAYYIIKPTNGSVVRFEASNYHGYQAMYHHWQTHFEKISITNVQHPEKIQFLNNYEFHNYINQFEMVL